MKKLTILIFSALISFNSYGEWKDSGMGMYEIIRTDGAKIISTNVMTHSEGNARVLVTTITINEELYRCHDRMILVGHSGLRYSLLGCYVLVTDKEE